MNAEARNNSSPSHKWVLSIVGFVTFSIGVSCASFNPDHDPQRELIICILTGVSVALPLAFAASLAMSILRRRLHGTSRFLESAYITGLSLAPAGIGMSLLTTLLGFGCVVGIFPIGLVRITNHVAAIAGVIYGSLLFVRFSASADVLSKSPAA